MKTSSAKQKGRRLCQRVKETLLAWQPDKLQDADILVTSSGSNGPDLQFSPLAKQVYPIVIEAKNCERLDVWGSIKQSQQHAVGRDEKPVLVFSRNREEHAYAILKLEDLLWLMK